MIYYVKEVNTILIVSDQTSSDHSQVKWHLLDLNKLRAYNVILWMNNYFISIRIIFLDWDLFFKKFVEINQIHMLSFSEWKSEAKLLFIS